MTEVGEGDVEDEGPRLDARTFEAFFAAEYRGLVALASVLCASRELAEELTQEALFTTYRKWDRVRSFDDPHAWARRVLINLTTSSWRRRSREARATRRLRDNRETYAELVEDDAEFWAAVRRLPTRQAQCVALRYLEDRSTADIARVLGIAEATVRAHLHAGRK